ncbi:hypothetical protein COCOBI_11-2100 [Coccomyxa sp. Obi]|nr:hypothetical protein COCOBI_11-2100 [Coccomyxa sp. Obi]
MSRVPASSPAPGSGVQGGKQKQTLDLALPDALILAIVRATQEWQIEGPSGRSSPHRVLVQRPPAAVVKQPPSLPDTAELSVTAARDDQRAEAQLSSRVPVVAPSYSWSSEDFLCQEAPSLITFQNMEQEYSSHHLPSDVWQCIASHLSTKEWVQKSHSCRLMHDLQPQHIDMTISGASASSWLQQHWGSAVTLKLAWKETDDMSWVVAHDAPPLNALEYLQIILQGESTPASSMHLTWLMSQTTCLRIISAETPTALVMPPLQTLRHLVLVADKFEDAAVAAVSQLHGLQTLKLASKDNPTCDKTRFTEASPIECGRLALGSMPSLTDVAIVDVCPAAIELPDGCKLHVFGWLEVLAREWCAAAAQAGELTTLHLSFEGRDVSPIWMNLPAFAACTQLFFVCRKIGCLHVTEQGVFEAPAFAALSAMYIDAIDVDLFIDASLRLRALHITAESMTVNFGDPEALALSLEEFSVAYRSLDGPGVVELLLMLQRVGKVVERVVIPTDARNAGFTTRQDLCYGVADPWPCPCGACLRCLESEQPIP